MNDLKEYRNILVVIAAAAIGMIIFTIIAGLIILMIRKKNKEINEKHLNLKDSSQVVNEKNDYEAVEEDKIDNKSNLDERRASEPFMNVLFGKQDTQMDEVWLSKNPRKPEILWDEIKERVKDAQLNK